MIFSSSIFLLFFLPGFFLLYFLKSGIQYRNIVLLLASILFYAYSEPIFVLVFIGVIVFNYFIAILIEAKKCKCTLIIAVGVNVLILFAFKYLSFVLKTFNFVFNNEIYSLIMPIGISFYIFQSISYCIDVYRNDVKAQRNIVKFSLYISMFPQLVAGPIVRYTDVEEKLTSRRITEQDFLEGIKRIVIGLAKKVLIADYLGLCVDRIWVLAEYQGCSMVTAWIGAIAYTYEIYYDFSGYSDMAIGIGRCLGFKFDENFNYPYFAKSISDFWRRWHMSLTRWFRDYVYIPLGGNRVSEGKHITNLLIVWGLTGLWHGADWSFVIWGLMHFAFQLAEKKIGFTEKMSPIIGNLYTIVVVTVGWVIFRAPNLKEAVDYLSYMVGAEGIIDVNTSIAICSVLIIGVIAVLFSYPVVEWGKSRIKKNANKIILNIGKVISEALLMILYLLSILVILSGSYSPFIYFNF